MTDRTLLSELSDREREIAGQCLKAAAEGPFFPDWEFHTLFGLDRDEVRKIAASWPDIDGKPSDVRLAIHNSLVNLIGYPHGLDRQWAAFISASRVEAEALLHKI